MHFESAFADNSPLAQTLTTLQGAPTVSTSIKKFGAQAGDFRRTGSLQIPGGMVFGTDDFTVEMWVYWNSAVGSAEWGICQLSTASGYAQNNSNVAILAHGSGQYGLYFGGFVPTSTAITLATWQHLALTRESGVVRLFVDGVKIHEFSSSFNFTGAQGVLGGYYNSSFNGDVLIDEFRVTNGVARYVADFTPPTDAFPDATNGGEIPIPAAARLSANSNPFWREAIPAVVGLATTTASRSVRDIYLAGRGSITATVKEDGTPTDTPVRRKVRLVRDRDGLMVRETWSNATTGAYSFTEIDENETYSVVSYDHNDNFRAVIADRITPTVA